MLLQDGLGLFQRCADRYGHERLRCHHIRNWNIKARLKTQIAIGDDPDQVAVLIDHRHSADVIALHHQQCFAHRPIGANGDGIDDHAGFGALHFVNLFRLTLNTHVAMNHADCALLS